MLTKTVVDDINPNIYEFLDEIGMPCHVNGYHYTAYALHLSIQSPTALRMMGLYSEVSIEFSTTPHRVERSIRFAIEQAFSHGSIDTLDSYFPASTIKYSSGKPTNSMFLSRATTILRRKIIRSESK